MRLSLHRLPFVTTIILLVLTGVALAQTGKIGGKVTPKLKPGKTASLTVTLKKGKASYLCTIPGHAAAGMKGVITVK